jgi:HAD superfamily hydrolase (TIGR01459 family)
MTVSPLPSLSAIANAYDGFLLDLWGVIHDGTRLYPGAKDALHALSAAGKKVVFISNAPRRVSRVITVLDQLGVGRALYAGAVSSGEAAYHALANGEVRVGRRYLFIGPERDAGALDGLDYIRVEEVAQADFILNVGFGGEQDEAAEVSGLLEQCRARGLPMLCLNPDMEVVKITGERYACAGVIAKQYEELGGAVRYFG